MKNNSHKLIIEENVHIHVDTPVDTRKLDLLAALASEDWISDVRKVEQSISLISKT